MTNPLISFCFASMNREGELFHMLNSLAHSIEYANKHYPSITYEVILNDSTESHSQFSESILSALFPFDNTSLSVYWTKATGIDRAYEFVGSKAKGTYVWLLSDDDEFILESLALIVKTLLSTQPTLLVVNSVLASYNLSVNYAFNLFGNIDNSSISYFDFSDLDDLYAAIGTAPSFISFALINRTHWESNISHSSLGTEFSHVTRIFSALPSTFTAVVISEPSLRLRMNNNQWMKRGLHIWLINWPYVVSRCFGLPAKLKLSLIGTSSFKSILYKAILYRAYGILSYPFKFVNDWGSLSKFQILLLSLTSLCLPRRLAFFILVIYSYPSKNWMILDAMR
jgi:hypothetical protein